MGLRPWYLWVTGFARPPSAGWLHPTRLRAGYCGGKIKEEPDKDSSAYHIKLTTTLIEFYMQPIEASKFPSQGLFPRYFVYDVRNLACYPCVSHQRIIPSVIPAKAGIQVFFMNTKEVWIPAFPPEADRPSADAGMTGWTQVFDIMRLRDRHDVIPLRGTRVGHFKSVVLTYS